MILFAVAIPYRAIGLWVMLGSPSARTSVVKLSGKVTHSKTRHREEDVGASLPLSGTGVNGYQSCVVNGMETKQPSMALHGGL